MGEKMAGPISFISWLRYIFPFSSIYSNIVDSMETFRVLLKHVIEDQRYCSLYNQHWVSSITDTN